MAKTPKKPAKTPAAEPKKGAAPAPAAKPAPAAGAKSTKAPARKPDREVIPGDAKLTVLAKSNPRRAGTTAGRTFALYKTGMTVAAWREAVSAADLDAGYLASDIRKGYVKVTLPAAPAAK